MKPRITLYPPHGWRCDGEGFVGFGRLPQNAYRAWRIQRDANRRAR